MSVLPLVTPSYADLIDALDEACEVATWMSGSNDFSPEGKASEGWQNVMRPKLWHALNVLGDAKASNQEDCP